ncbi:MAG: glycosyltransferase family 39 protein [Opitutaceae bacterium]
MGVTCLLKVVLALVVPITGDEAYFALWGMYPDFGYYDHPPMAGWWLWVMLLGGNSALMVRLPAILVSAVAALVIRGVLRPIDRRKADVVATLFVLTPFHTLGIMTTTDTPLILFSAISAAFAYRAYLRGRWWDAVLAGVFLGGAFLSKYFAVLLGIAYAALFPVMRGPRRGPALVLLILLGALPAITLNVLWNFEHGWPNIMFNLFNRHGDSGFSLVNPLIFLAATAFWLGPGIVSRLWAARAAIRAGFSEWWNVAACNGTVVFVFASLVPAGIFFLLSWTKAVGFHWLMSFFPLFFPVLFAVVDVTELARMLKPTAWFSAILGAFVLVVVQLPVAWFKTAKSYESILLSTDTSRVLEAFEPWTDEYLLATSSYTKAAVLEFKTGKHIPVVGRGSFNGRHDDMLTDFRELDGQDILLLDIREERVARGKAWFRESEIRTVEVLGGEFAILLGRDFDYETYRRDVLQQIADEFYDIPPWLAGMMKESFFLERYELAPATGAKGK